MRMRSLLPVIALILLSVKGQAQPAPLDCSTARYLNNKNSVIVDGNSFSGTGITTGEAGSCFTQPERGPYWFTFKICESGSLTAFIDPEGSSDFDFTLYDITNGCQNKIEIACNYEVAVGLDNITGIGCSNGPSCVPEVMVAAGNVYAILFDRYQLSSTAGFELTLGGTCTFVDTSEFYFAPEILTGSSPVCGLTGSLEAVPQPGTGNFLWSYSGPGFAAFSAPNDVQTSFSVAAPGIYKFYFNTSKTICNTVYTLRDSVEIEVKAKQQLYTGRDTTVCESSKNLIDLNTLLSGTPPAGGVWRDDSSSERLDNSGNFYPFAIGGSSYGFRYVVTDNGNCIDTSATIKVNVIGEVTALVDSSICFNGGANFRIYSSISGGIAGTYRVNGTPISGNNYTSVLLPNGFDYSYTITDASGCGSAILQGTENCNCITDAGTMAGNFIFDCEEQSVVGIYNGNASLDGDDILRFLLYTDPSDPIGSAVDTGVTSKFILHQGITAGTTYYIAALAGSKKQGNVDLNDQCLSLSSGIKVIFPDTPVVSLELDTLICQGERAFLRFKTAASANVRAKYTANGETAFVNLAPGYSTQAVMPLVSTGYVLTSVTDALGCTGTVSGSAQVNVIAPPPVSYTLDGDSAICLSSDPEGMPKVKFTLNTGDTVTVIYTINGTLQPPVTGVYDGSIFNLPKITSALNQFQVTAIQPNANGCTFPVNGKVINYYYLDKPAINLSANRTEFCSSLSSVTLTFQNTTGLLLKIKYTINGTPYSFTTLTTRLINFAVTEPLDIRIDSVFYNSMGNCGFKYSDSLFINMYNRPTVNITTYPKSCIRPNGGAISLSTSDPGVTYSLDNVTFTPNTTFSDLAPGGYLLYMKRGETCVYTQGFVIGEVPVYTLSTTLTHTTCNKDNGSIEPAIAGSFTPPVLFTYNGTSQNTNLAPGPYVVSATDNTGCTVTRLDTILPSEPFFFTAAPYDSADCFTNEKGSVVGLATGGNGVTFTYSSDGFTYQTNDTLKNLDPRYYTIYGRNDVGCIDSVRLKVNVKQKLQFALEVLKYLTCYESADAAIKVKITNSADNLVYSMDGVNYNSSNVYTGLSGGSYNFYAMETNGCRREDFVSTAVTRPAKITLSVPAKSNPLCWDSKDGFIVLNATGGSGPSYIYTRNEGLNFQPGKSFTGLDSGTYVMFAKNPEGCTSDTIKVTLTRPDSLVISGASFTFTDDNTANLTISAYGGTPPLSYSIDGVNYQSDSVFNGLPKGEYTVYVKDYKGCISTRKVLIGGVGVDELLARGIAVYPNPFAAAINLVLPEIKTGQITVYNTLGQAVKNVSFTGDRLTLNTSDWIAGLYTLQVNVNGTVYNVLLIKE